MFRIKTDIRQYKCETKDKVEKLIRNWVIRPSDLIYNRDAKEWLPIGEHPSFVGLFGMLAEQEKNTPDTVVTARSPYSDGVPPDDEEVVGPGNVISEAVDEAPKEEVTHIVSRPAFDEKSEAEEAPESEDDEPEKDEDLAEDDEVEESEPAEPVEPIKPDEQRDTDEVEAADREEVDGAARETDVFEQGEIAESVGSNPAPPEAPEGVEPPSSNDEVTMMTEKTLEMLKVTDEDDAAEDEDDADEPEEIGDAASDEADEDVAEDEETTNVVESPLDSEAEEDEAADADEDADEEEADGGDEADEDPSDSSKQPRLGRHDLPEELFATNEISSPEVQEKMKTIDDLGELSGASDAEDEEESSNDGKTPRWGSKLQEDSGIDEAWAVIEDEVPSAADEEAALRTTDELDREDEDEDEDDDWDEEEWEEEWEGDTPEPELIQVRDFVSEGYKMALPFPIRPTDDDIRLGLKPTKVSKTRRERTYPAPEPKKLDEVHTRTFNLTPKPPRDQTAFLVAGVAFIFAVMVMVVASC